MYDSKTIEYKGYDIEVGITDTPIDEIIFNYNDLVTFVNINHKSVLTDFRYESNMARSLTQEAAFYFVENHLIDLNVYEELGEKYSEYDIDYGIIDDEDRDELEEKAYKLIDEKYYYMTVEYGDHGQQWLSASCFNEICSCSGWDSGTIGFVYVEKKKFHEECPKSDPEQWLRGVIEMAHKEFNGELYDFEIYHDGGYTDGCAHFEDEEGAIMEAKATIDCYVSKRLDKRFKKLKTLIKNHVPLRLRDGILDDIVEVSHA